MGLSHLGPLKINRFSNTFKEITRFFNMYLKGNRFGTLLKTISCVDIFTFIRIPGVFSVSLGRFMPSSYPWVGWSYPLGLFYGLSFV